MKNNCFSLLEPQVKLFFVMITTAREEQTTKYQDDPRIDFLKARRIILDEKQVRL